MKKVIEMIYGRKDGSQIGRKADGLGMNRTIKCRHPTIKLNRGKRKTI